MQWLLGVPVLVALSLGVAHAELSSSEMLPFSAGSLGVETPASDEDEMFPDEKLLSENELFPGKGPIKIPDFSERFAKGQYEFGLQFGFGFTFDLPAPVDTGGRTDIQFAYFFPNFKYNLTGIMGESYSKGALYWVVEFGTAITVRDPEHGKTKVDEYPTYVVGFIPFQLEYKFVRPERKWAPFVFAGVGMSVGNWHKGAVEISTAFQFILQGGAGIEYFLPNGKSVNFSYRLWHLSNSNLKDPNTGLNAHVFSVGFSF